MTGHRANAYMGKHRQNMIALAGVAHSVPNVSCAGRCNLRIRQQLVASQEAEQGGGNASEVVGLVPR